MTATLIRLAYTLSMVPRTQKVLLLPHLAVDSPPLTEAEARALRKQMHPLDQPIVQQICQSTVFGQITDAQLGRLLPLLAQRRTMVGQARLRILDAEQAGLSPRALVVRHPRGTTLTLRLERPDGSELPWESGRLLSGSETFFLVEYTAYPVRSSAPWHLVSWSREPQQRLSGERLQPPGRDALVRDLRQAGVPDADLAPLAVRRGPPNSFCVEVTQAQVVDGEPEVEARLEAHYDAGIVYVEPQRLTGALYVDGAEPTADGGDAGQVAEAAAKDAEAAAKDAEASGGGQPLGDGGVTADMDANLDPDAPELAGLTERDVVAEEEARGRMRQAGFNFDRGRSCFVARGEAALRVLDSAIHAFPNHWEVDRGGHTLVFGGELRLGTQVTLLEERGLLDLRIQVQAVGEDATVAALVDMQELLRWLKTDRRYVQLTDGSFAAPSVRFRQGLRIVRDLGADGDRALVSPLCVGLLRAMGDSAALTAADEATRAWLAELSSLESPPSIEVPVDLDVSLRDYQRRGLDWLAMLHRFRLTGILADDMGLGKTVQALALLAHIREREGQKPSLVVAPTSVVAVWRDEAARFAPNMKVVSWYGPPQVRHALNLKDADLVVTSYGILRRDAELMQAVPFRYVILDEAQNTKNAASHNARAIRMLKSERRLALTGTPLENRPEELWSIFDFLAPGFLGSLRAFRKNYALPMSRGDTDARALLRMRMQPLILRRLKRQVAAELPDKVEQTVRCDMGPSQRALYDHVAGELRDSIKEKIAREGIEAAQLDILAALTRLRQICCDPALLPKPPHARIPPSAKLALFEELMREALASERAVVVFSQFVQMQKRLIDVVRRLGVDPLWLHGGTKNRDKVVTAFQDPKGPQIIIVSLRAGGTGLTLTRADTVVHYDPWWNPAVERQATDRAHRLGQKNVVTVYRLVCTHSIEERVLSLAARKEALAQELLAHEEKSGAKRISREEVLALFA